MLRRGLLLLVVVMLTLGYVAITRAAPVNHAVPTTPVVLTQFPTVVVVKSSANVRSGPGTEYAVISGARPGQRLSVVGCNADCSWYRLANDCWIAAFLVSPELPPAAPTVMVSIPITIPGQPTQCPQTNSPTTTYAGPGTFYPTVDMRPAGECVAIIGRNSAGDWYQLYRGMWIQSAAVMYADPIETIPVTDGIFTATPVPPPTPIPTATPTITPTVVPATITTVGEWVNASQEQKAYNVYIWTQNLITNGTITGDPVSFGVELYTCIDNTLRGTAEILGANYAIVDVAAGCAFVLNQ